MFKITKGLLKIVKWLDDDYKKSYASICDILQGLSMVESRGFVNDMDLNKLSIISNFFKKYCFWFKQTWRWNCKIM